MEILHEFGVLKPYASGYRFENMNHEWLGGFIAGDGCIGLHAASTLRVKVTSRTHREIREQLAEKFGT